MRRRSRLNPQHLFSIFLFPFEYQSTYIRPCKIIVHACESIAMSTAAEETPVSSTANPPLFRKIELYSPKKHYNGITASFGEFPIETLNPSISETGRAVPGGKARVVKVEASIQEKRSVAGEFYEHGFDPELSFRISFQKIGAGLENLGNTCYLNSVLQCLTYTEPFAAYLHSGKHKLTCRNAGFCAMCALQNHVMDARQSTGKILRPFHLVKNLKCISRNFRNYRQEDAHEYMVNLLESMHKCCLPYGVQSESSSAYEKSQVHRIFGGQLRSQVKCEQCSYCSNKFDPFLDLSLEIMKADSLRKALEHFTAMELLDGGEKQYQCQRCKEKVRAFKQLTVHKAPHVLTIHLKRFGSTIYGEKLSKKVEYGPTLDLNPFISDPHAGGFKYTLYGVLVHAGWSTHSGHYFCYVRTSIGTWYSLDDNQVTQVSETTVLSREAYMLFYVRDGTFAAKHSDILIAPKPDISTSSESKATPMVERKTSAALYRSVKNLNDAPPSEIVPATDTSLQQFVKNEGLLFHSKDHVETKYYYMDVDGDVFANKHEPTSSKDPEKPLLSIDSKLPSIDSKLPSVDYKLPSVDSKLPSVDSKLPSDCDQKSNTTNESAQVTPLMKSMEVESLLPIATVCGVRQDAAADFITKELLCSFHQTESKLKKPKKISLVKGLYFGRKHLFYMSLHPPKKKHTRSKKHNLTSRNRINKRIVDDSNADSCEASTSETFQAIDVAKCSHSTTKLERSRHVKIVRNSSHDKEFHTSTNSATHETSSKSSRFYSIEEDTEVKGKITEDANILNFSVNSVMTSLKEMPVVRWDEKNIFAEQKNEIEKYPKRNVGYILDEWDEEYDKGKRKKVKKCRQWFGVGMRNPFQSLSGFTAQQNTKNLMIERKSSGNRPFRI